MTSVAQTTFEWLGGPHDGAFRTLPGRTAFVEVAVEVVLSVETDDGRDLGVTTKVETVSVPLCRGWNGRLYAQWPKGGIR